MKFYKKIAMVSMLAMLITTSYGVENFTGGDNNSVGLKRGFADAHLGQEDLQHQDGDGAAGPMGKRQKTDKPTASTTPVLAQERWLNDIDPILKEVIEKATLPQDPYVRIDIQGQIQRYRKLLNPIWGKLEKKDTGLIALYHVPKLIDVFRESIQIVRDFIIKNAADNANGVSNLTQLGKIWSIAKKIDEKQLLSFDVMSRMTLFLSELMGILDIKRFTEISSNIDNLLSNPSMSSDIFSFQLQNIIWSFFRQEDLDTFKGIKSKEAPIFIIFANPTGKNKGVSHQTFVNEYCHLDYSVNLALFDLVYTPHGSKRAAHYNRDNNVAGFLRHDIIHHDFIKKIESFFDLFPTRKTLKEIGKISQYYKESGNSNASIVLRNGIFLLFHEIEIFRLKKEEGPFQEDLRQKEHLDLELVKKYIQFEEKHMISLVQESLASTDHSKFSSNQQYKVAYRDWEDFLREGADQQGEIFLPLIDINDQKKGSKGRPYPFAMKPDGTIFIVEKSEDLRHGDQYLSDQKLETFTKEEDEKMKKGVKKEVRAWDFFPLISKETKKSRQQRYVLMNKTLLDGYNRFWDTFTYYIDEYCKEHGDIFQEIPMQITDKNKRLGM